MSKKNGAFEMDMMGWLILAVLVLVISIVSLMILKGKGIGAIQYLKNLIAFGST